MTGLQGFVCGVLVAGAGVGLGQQQQGPPVQAGVTTQVSGTQAVGLDAGVDAAISAAMVGNWTGVLEYRDYQSDGRVKLPTWLEIKTEGQGLRFHYIYDDGPAKVVDEMELVTVDGGKATYTVVSKPGEAGTVYAIAGLEGLKSGRGKLILTGPGKENDRAVEVRTTLRITRNLLEILRETRLPGEEFKFRHAYTFTRAAVPVVTSARP